MGIVFRGVELIYQPNTPFFEQALQEVDLQLELHKFYAIAGHTGSGKSTLIQLLNGLLLPTRGEVQVADFKLACTGTADNLKDLRKKVGLVFQFPESQLFEETVEREIAFGLINFGFSKAEAKQRAARALEQVGLSPSFLSRSPFSLSGGEMRKLAIASVLAYSPEILVLDEPTAGLDAAAQKEMLDQFSCYQKETNCTVILVTHQMDDVAQYADEVVVMKAGRVLAQGSCADVFSNQALLGAAGLGEPTAVRYQRLFEQKLGIKLPICCYTMEILAEQIRVMWAGEMK